MLRLTSWQALQDAEDLNFHSLQSCCPNCVWEVYRQHLLEYNKQQAILRGEPEPIDPLEALEKRLKAQQGSAT
jgi:Oxidoreductase-like protein, N-terminal